MRIKFLAANLALFVFVLSANHLSAQNVGIGFQAGDPTGLNLHFRGTKPMHLDILFAWDFSDRNRNFFFRERTRIVFQAFECQP